MKLIAPEYYNEFTCIADKCRNSCCIGWEIYIDRATYDYYKNHNGSLKEAFCNSIAVDDGAPHFILGKDERCPFLNDRNLCDIYTELGENALCQICTDHPRFRNFFSDRTEIGLGLCCEEACRIILNNDSEFQLVKLEDDGVKDDVSDDEADFFEIRDKMLNLLQDKSKSFDERFAAISDMLGIKLLKKEYAYFFDGLEYMENNICELLSESSDIKASDVYLERLAVYFVYRHLADSVFDGKLAERAVFAYISAKTIEKICKNDILDELLECARKYSSEIEYSEENTEEILNRIGEIIEILV